MFTFVPVLNSCFPRGPVRAALVAALAVLLACTATAQRTEYDTAKILFERADALVAQGEQGEALERYRTVASRFREHELAPRARFQAARLLHANREYVDAFDEYQKVINDHPQSDLFTRVIDGQMDIAREVLDEYAVSERAGRPKPGRNVPDKELASDLYRLILENARHTERSPEIHYARSVALEREQLVDESVASHQEFVDAYPDHYLADDSAFQAAYIFYKKARDGNNPDAGAMDRAAFAFQEFLMRHPESEKIAEARYCLGEMNEMRRKVLYEAARQYEKLGKPVAAQKMYQEALGIGYTGVERNRTLERIQERLAKEK